ncbi:hypothetical protein ACJJTC_017248 [Scirpophaga incertulas]
MADKKCSEEVEKLVEEFRTWANNQPHLPNNLEHRLVKRFLHGCYYDLAKTKTAFELFISIRESSPELLNDRDPLSLHIQKVFSILHLAQIKISGNRKLWIWKLNDPGMKNFDCYQDAKMFFITTDMWLLFDEFYEDGDVVLMDTKDINSIMFLYTKFSLSLARKMLKFQQEAIPVRLKEIHIVNAPTFINKLFSFIKPFLRKEITKMIHVHACNSDTLYDHFDKNDLPEDYGGTRGKMADHMEEIVQDILSKREYFLQNDLWRVENQLHKSNLTETKGQPLLAVEID